ncbi:hypothetical protein JDV02_007110 [Purpureocillium takamizusanense]|uniref:Uncharacterized protein n=1 Tax=Purpureocillium takamizusanense TaxID=2060973 RepID=A0A9Q8QLQ4_9HYPO|nr:uncharacterized protein JDV02_007110 [Purpureocillium takamizusanense]UNI21091.1 hypothetical protein JDV02_007110 [Purpureocillium takamizusanense]
MTDDDRVKYNYCVYSTKSGNPSLFDKQEGCIQCKASQKRVRDDYLNMKHAKTNFKDTWSYYSSLDSGNRPLDGDDWKGPAPGKSGLKLWQQYKFDYNSNDAVNDKLEQLLAKNGLSTPSTPPATSTPGSGEDVVEEGVKYLEFHYVNGFEQRLVETSSGVFMGECVVVETVYYEANNRTMGFRLRTENGVLINGRMRRATSQEKETLITINGDKVIAKTDIETTLRESSTTKVVIASEGAKKLAEQASNGTLSTAQARTKVEQVAKVHVEEALSTSLSTIATSSSLEITKSGGQGAAGNGPASCKRRRRRSAVVQY